MHYLCILSFLLLSSLASAQLSSLPPSSGGSSGSGLTDAQLRASPITSKISDGTNTLSVNSNGTLSIGQGTNTLTINGAGNLGAEVTGTVRINGNYTTQSFSGTSAGDLVSGQDVNEYSQLNFNLHNTFVATVQIKLSTDNVNFYSAMIYHEDGTAPTTSVSSPGNYYVLMDARYYRATISSYTSGQVDFAAFVNAIPRGASSALWLASAANQTTGNASLSNIDSKLGGTLAVSGPLTDAQLRASAVPVSGTFWQNTQPVSLATIPIATGASTSALQTTGNSSLSSIDTKLPALGQALAAASIPMVLTAAQLSTLTPLSSVSVSNFPASQAVTGTFWQTTQPVSIASSVAVTGPLTDTQLRAVAVPVSGTVAVSNSFALDATLTGGTQRSKITDGTNNAAVKAASTAAGATDPALVVAISPNNSVAVTGPLTDTQLRASAVPVSLTSTTVTGTVTANATLSAETTKVIGTVNVASAQNIGLSAGSNLVGKVGFDQTTPGTTNKVYISNDGQVAATQSGTWTAQPGNTANTTPWIFKLSDGTNAQTIKAASTAAAAADLAAVVVISPNNGVSLGTSIGKTVTMKTGSLASSAATADQVVVTYTVTAAKTFYLEYIDIAARLTSFAATATNFGTCSLESPAGTKLYTQMLAGTGVTAPPVFEQFAEPLPIATGVVIRIVCTPSAVTAFTWQANLGGYEK